MFVDLATPVVKPALIPKKSIAVKSGVPLITSIHSLTFGSIA